MSLVFANLTIDIHPTDNNEVTLSLAGDIDEGFDYRRIIDQARLRQFKRVVFHLQNVRNFNSIGLRSWVALIRELSPSGQLVFSECSVAVVDQFNMVPGSFGSATIASVYAPYFCEDHGEVNRLLTIDDQVRRGEAPELLCAKCQMPLEFDSLEETYFVFAKEGQQNAG